MNAGPFRSILRQCILSFTGWSLVAFFVAAQGVSSRSDAWSDHLILSLRNWLPWVCLTPVILWITERFPIDAYRWKRHLPLHFTVALLSTTTIAYWRRPNFTAPPRPPPHFQDSEQPGAPPFTSNASLPEPVRPPTPPPGRPPSRGFDFLDYFTREVPLYLALISGAHTLLFLRRDKEQATSLVLAQLDSLRWQLQPHFLFNTLNAVGELAHQSPQRADEMLHALSDLLRHSLETARAQTTALRDELDLIRKYRELLTMRFGAHLQIHLRTTPAVEEARIPSMLLQPLVENAVEHGLFARSGPGEIWLEAWKEGEQIHLQIRDNGIGLTPDPPEGFGLGHTKQRLEALYGNAARLSLCNRPEGGAQVDLWLPLELGPHEDT